MPSAWPTRDNAPRWFVAVLWILLLAIVGGFENVPAVWP